MEWILIVLGVPLTTINPPVFDDARKCADMAIDLNMAISKEVTEAIELPSVGSLMADKSTLPIFVIDAVRAIKSDEAKFRSNTKDTREVFDKTLDYFDNKYITAIEAADDLCEYSKKAFLPYGIEKECEEYAKLGQQYTVVLNIAKVYKDYLISPKYVCFPRLKN